MFHREVESGRSYSSIVRLSFKFYRVAEVKVTSWF